MSYVLGKAFRRGKKTVRYAYKNGKKSSKVLVRKLVNKKNLKKGAKILIILGVEYLIDDYVGTDPYEEQYTYRSRKGGRGFSLPFIGDM